MLFGFRRIIKKNGSTLFSIILVLAMIIGTMTGCGNEDNIPGISGEENDVSGEESKNAKFTEGYDLGELSDGKNEEGEEEILNEQFDSNQIMWESGQEVQSKSGIAIDYGIELRTDVTGDGVPDRVQIFDDERMLETTVCLDTKDGRWAQLSYDEDIWASSYLVSGDLSDNGAADIVLMRISFGMYGIGDVSVLCVTEGEEPDSLMWQEYPDNFIHNPAIEIVQPDNFEAIACVGATVTEENEHHLLRLIAMDLEAFDGGDTVKCIDCSWQGDGWYIEDMRTIVGYITEDKDDELLKNNTFNIQ